MSSTSTPPKPYGSINALREANDELISTLPDDETRWSEAQLSTMTSQLMEFITRAIETGGVLDLPSDRKVAQGLIDYWLAKPYLISRETTTNWPLFGKADALLKPFDANAVRSVAERGDALMRALGHEDRDLARQILLRLLDLSDRTCTSSPKTRDTLFFLDEIERGNGVVEKLHNAGVVTVTPTKRGDVFAIRYEAIARRWQRLCDRIEERVKFRHAASFWVASRRDRGALLSANLAKSAARYGALSTVEEEFVGASLRYARQRLISVLIAASLLVLCLPPAVWLAYTRLYVPWRATGEIELARSSVVGPKRREEAIRWVARAQQKLDFWRVPLEHLNLNDLVAPPQANFIETALVDVHLDNAILPAAQFSGSTISNSYFVKAGLENARFDEAEISNTTFIKSNLSRSVFDRARLCNVNFSESDLSEVSFRDAKYEDAPMFQNTAWWLATGWTLKEIDEFSKKFRGRDSNSPIFKRELAKFEEASHKGGSFSATLEYVKALDGIAWTYAIYGIDLDKAQHYADQAHEAIGKVNLPNEEREKRRSFIADTLGYILMQKDQPAEALPLLKAAAKSRQNLGAMFRYAIALHASGDEDEAVKKLRMAAGRGYVPSHELFLLANYFTSAGSFVTALMQHQPERRPLESCPRAQR